MVFRDITLAVNKYQELLDQTWALYGHATKTKVDAECRVFNKNGLLRIYLVKSEVKPCVWFVGSRSLFKDYNLRHYEAKHAEKYRNLADAERARTSEALRAKGFFTKLHSSREAATKTSFIIAHKTGPATRICPWDNAGLQDYGRGKGRRRGATCSRR